MTIKIQGVIFDLDGTLGDTVFVSVEAIVRAVFKLTGKRYTHAEIIDLFGPSEPGILRQLVGEEHLEQAFQFFLKEYETIHDHHKIGAYPGIEEIQELLDHHRIRQAIVTGKSRESAQISLRYFNLNGYFDAIETGSAEGSVKKIYIQKVVSTWGISPEHVLYLGDAPSDVTIARNAGVIPISVAWAETADLQRLAQQNPYALFESVEDLKIWLNSTLNRSPF